VNDGDVSYSFTSGYHLPESKLFLIKKKPYCRFYNHNWYFIKESRLYVKTSR